MRKGQTTTINQTKVLAEEIVEDNRYKVGLFGGSFNPPHYGHLIMAERVKDQLELDEVQFLPTGEPPHLEGKTTIDSAERVDMVNLAIEDNPAFSLNLTDVSRSGKSYTYDTMVELTKTHPEIDYYFIIGGDSVEKLSTWYKIDELIQLVQFVGVARDGFTESSEYPILWVDVPKIGISSTTIRENVRDGSSIHYQTPEKVVSYIEEKGLYVNDKTS